ncbi:hypothetical protein SprV_0301379800 [Sparganum proliferum]
MGDHEFLDTHLYELESVEWLEVSAAGTAMPTPFCHARTSSQVPERSFELSSDALAAFDKVKTALAVTTLLTHSAPNDLTSLTVDAFNVPIGAVPQ